MVCSSVLGLLDSSVLGLLPFIPRSSELLFSSSFLSIPEFPSLNTVTDTRSTGVPQYLVGVLSSSFLDRDNFVTVLFVFSLLR